MEYLKLCILIFIICHFHRLLDYLFEGIGIFDAKYSRSIWQVSGKVIFKGKANIGHGSKISVGENGCLTIGNKFCITAESSIVCQKEIVFGNDVLISWENLFMDTDAHKIIQNGIIINGPEKIIVGNHAWIGCRCTILKGSIFMTKIMSQDKRLFDHLS